MRYEVRTISATFASEFHSQFYTLGRATQQQQALEAHNITAKIYPLYPGQTWTDVHPM